VPTPRFVSFAVDAEDVVLWRALGRRAPGRYLDASVQDASSPSATRAFHDAGWSGVVLAPADAATALRAQRPRDLVVTDAEEALAALGTVDLVVADRGLVERLLTSGAAPAVVLLPAAPGTPAPDEVPGYTSVLRVGDSQVLVADALRAELGAALSRPPSLRGDGYERAAENELRAERDEALAALMRWRAVALTGWPGTAAPADEPSDAARTIAELAHELHKVRSTLSWRVTAPLRAVSGVSVVRRARGR